MSMENCGIYWKTVEFYTKTVRCYWTEEAFYREIVELN